MITIKVKEKEYKLKFGYKSFKNSGILREVTALQKERKEKEDDDTEEKVEFMGEVLDLTSKLVLVALQRNHEEYRVDFSDDKSCAKAIDMVDDLLDDYTEEEECMPIMDLFEKLLEELFEGGFLSKKSETLEKSAEKTDATIIPMDHRQKEN